MSATGRNLPGRTRDPRDYYKTPGWCVYGLLRAVPWLHPTLDPCCGTGAIIEACQEAGETVRGIELDPNLCQRAFNAGHNVDGGDGLLASWEEETVIANPPYRDALRWVLKGVTECRRFAMLLRLGFLASRGRQGFWREFPPSHLVICSTRPSFTADGRTDASEYAWFVWDKGLSEHGMYETQLQWISADDRAPALPLETEGLET